MHTYKKDLALNNLPTMVDIYKVNKTSISPTFTAGEKLLRNNSSLPTDSLAYGQAGV